MLDHEIIEHATKKIKQLKMMLLATGFHKDMLQAIMEAE